MITEGAGELREANSNTDRAGGTDGSGKRPASYEEIGMLRTNEPVHEICNNLTF